MTFNRIAKLHAVSKKEKKQEESKLGNNQNFGCPSCTYMYIRYVCCSAIPP